MLCIHVLRVMDILHLEEISKHHIVERWTKHARDILPKHLVQYQKDNSANLSFTCRSAKLYLEAMEVMRMGDASAASFDHMYVGLEVLLVSGEPLAEKRDGLAFEDRLDGTVGGRLQGNVEIAFVEGDGAGQCHSGGQSVNALPGLELQTSIGGPEGQQTTGGRHLMKVLSKRTRFCSICRREGHEKTTCQREGLCQKNPRKPRKCKNCGIEGHQ
ncbi:hypothetical protein ACQJBY_026580 [Aegilops geniculata]